MATFEHQKSYFLKFQEGIKDEADLEGVLASILGRFLKAPGTSKMRFSYGRVAFFEDFGRWKIRCYFGGVLGGSWGGFGEGFGRQKRKKNVFKRDPKRSQKRRQKEMRKFRP